MGWSYSRFVCRAHLPPEGGSHGLITDYVIPRNGYVDYRNGGTGAIAGTEAAGMLHVAAADQTARSCGSQPGRLCHPWPPGKRNEVRGIRASRSRSETSPRKLASHAMPSRGTAT